jgi:polar amino acid transport system permease protein
MKGFDLMAILLNPEFRSMLVHGLQVTLVIAICSWLLAMTLAVALLVIRLSPSRIADRLVAGYVSYHRNVPTLVQLMLWYFGISSLLPGALQGWLGEHSGEALFAIIGLGLCQAAYFSEDLRSGLRSIPAGQAEAARALGHSYIGAMRNADARPQCCRRS